MEKAGVIFGGQNISFITVEIRLDDMAFSMWAKLYLLTEGYQVDWLLPLQAVLYWIKLHYVQGSLNLENTCSEKVEPQS